MDGLACATGNIRYDQGTRVITSGLSGKIEGNEANSFTLMVNVKT